MAIALQLLAAAAAASSLRWWRWEWKWNMRTFGMRGMATDCTTQRESIIHVVNTDHDVLPQLRHGRFRDFCLYFICTLKNASAKNK